MSSKESPKKTKVVSTKGAQGGKKIVTKTRSPKNILEADRLGAAEALSGYGKSDTFTVKQAGKKKHYQVKSGYGFFILPLQKAQSLNEVNELIEEGLTWNEVGELIRFLDLKVPEIAKAASVSVSTVSRWDGESSIGVPGSNQFFRVDELIRKGVELFGGLAEFKQWLDNPNLALGNKVPARLITSHIGIDMVEEAIDALHYGNVM